MTRPLSSLGAPAENGSAPDKPLTIHEVSVQDSETSWTDGTDARSPDPAADSDLLDALTCRLIFAARALALNCILTSDYRPIGGPIVPDGNQVCSGCTMHSHGRKLPHTASCGVGEVLWILDRMEACVLSCRRAGKPVELRSGAGAATPLPDAGEYGEPWRYKEMASGGVDVETPEGYLVASLHGAAQEQLDHAERIVACVNVCADIPTEMLLNAKPLASMTRRVDDVIAVGRLFPGLVELRTSQGVAR